jgi:outer membrane lipoprotein carrier protein
MPYCRGGKEKSMILRSLTVLAAGLLLVLLAVTAQAAGLREVIQALESPFQAATPTEKRIQDYTADFTQESRIASLDRLQRARGQVNVRFDYRRSQDPLVMFHWEYQEPTTQEIVSDGKTLWVYLPENNQVIQSDIAMVSRAGESNPMTFLTGLGNLSRDFLIDWGEPNRDSAGNYLLAMRPHQATALIDRMVIVVDRYALEEKPAETATSGRKLVFPILSTTVYDPSGNRTTIEFSDLRLNRGLAAAQFRFTMPAGVEVVRPTGKEMGL